uniref:ATP-binding cassette domain-containing protein n=1 Tax=uncultured Campylobacter sp. TaxID=218934 RepID=UPI002633AEA9
GRPQASDEEVERAARAAGCEDFILRLAHGYDTRVGTGGSHVSGGERQRIAIARALYKDPQILIFDEATSALDNASEKEISNVIEKIKQSKIVFVIAHRLSTIERADNIAVMKNGRILAIGTDAKLTGECEEYRSLKGIMQNG